uniref:(northern house mosquito) hypothetical protein n=1 Tax=Culex pipiens TaxID=7175 RepID=A0A8D8F7C1_CULPI
MLRRKRLLVPQPEGQTQPPDCGQVDSVQQPGIRVRDRHEGAHDSVAGQPPEDPPVLWLLSNERFLEYDHGVCRAGKFGGVFAPPQAAGRLPHPARRDGQVS